MLRPDETYLMYRELHSGSAPDLVLSPTTDQDPLCPGARRLRLTLRWPSASAITAAVNAYKALNGQSVRVMRVEMRPVVALPDSTDPAELAADGS